MLKWFTLIAAIVVVWLWRGSRRVGAEHEAQRQRVKQRLKELGLDFVDVRQGRSYGFPTYIVVFDSVEKSRSFRESSGFRAFLEEVQAIHGHLGDSTNMFDASRAVGVEPYAR